MKKKKLAKVRFRVMQSNLAGTFDSAQNEGFKERQERFVTSWDESVQPPQANYTSESVVFAGKLYHDFINIDAHSNCLKNFLLTCHHAPVSKYEISYKIRSIL